LPNPGFAAVLDAFAGRWRASALQIVVHLMADRPEETQTMVRALEAVDNVGAVELGFAPLLADDVILLAIEMSRGELPLIANLPPDQVLRVGPAAVDRGARAVSVAAPRGTLMHDGRMVSGKLHGPSLFPAALDLVYAAAKAGLPVIGAGGVGSQLEADAMLAAGAIGVQLDTRLWLPTATRKASTQ
jgi:dihydroorotate dehydrogenase